MVPAQVVVGSPAVSGLTFYAIGLLTMTKLLTVIETTTFLRDVKRSGLTEDEHRSLIEFLAANPMAGVVMEGTGGVRKVRFAGQGAGKSGSYRVVYYFHDMEMPVFALALFAKNEKANLTMAERNELRAIMPRIVQEYREGIKHGRR
jgi:hypothetical protein